MARDARNNTGKFDCQVERKNQSPYRTYHMDVYFSAKTFSNRIIIYEVLILFEIH